MTTTTRPDLKAYRADPVSSKSYASPANALRAVEQAINGRMPTTAFDVYLHSQDGRLYPVIHLRDRSGQYLQVCISLGWCGFRVIG